RRRPPAPVGRPRRRLPGGQQRPLGQRRGLAGRIRPVLLRPRRARGRRRPEPGVRAAGAVLGRARDPGPDRLRRELVTPAETVTEWEPGTFVENLAAGPDGSWLVTIPSHRRIDRVHRDGRSEVFAELDRMPTGIVADADGAFVIAGSINTRDWQLVRIEHGRSRAVCALPDLVFGNGMQRVGERLLAVDSALGLALD